MTLTPEQRSLRARLGAHVLHSRYDSKAITAPARKAFLDRFEKQAIEEAAARGETLTQAEIGRRAGHLLQAYMLKLSIASAKARRKKFQR